MYLKCILYFLYVFIETRIKRRKLKAGRLIINSFIARRQFVATLQQTPKENKYCTHDMNTLLILSGWILLSSICIYPVVFCDCSRDIDGEERQAEMTTQDANAKTDYDVKVFYKMMTRKFKAHPTPPVGIIFY